jgi:hypothetical protein
VIGGFDGSIDAELYLARVWRGYSEPRDYHYLVYGVGERDDGSLYPKPRAVTGGPLKAAELIRDLDDQQPESHGGIPIFRVEYAGRE